MSISDKDRRLEIIRLDKAEEILKQKLDVMLARIQKYKAGIVDDRKQIWDELPHYVWDEDDAVELSQNEDILKGREQDYHFLNREAMKLKKMVYSPYFGRIDFKEKDDSNTEKIYIGIGSLVDDDSEEFLIYDWRAPIAGMFYDYELGTASYMAPIGSISGDILLKRQYSIEGGKMVYMLDSSLKIDDEILQEVLAKSVDDKMKTIVTTIQREQNRIIRNEEHGILAVQGPAGSGKTSIALHRAAYLLYSHRKNIEAANILILSPNRIFSDYISNVLPELGEENVQRATFVQFARIISGNRFGIEDMNGQMEYILSAITGDADDNRLSAIKFKMSECFYRTIKRYINYLENQIPDFKDVEFGGKVIITADVLAEFYGRIHKLIPLAGKLDNARNKVIALMEEIENEVLLKIEEELYAESESNSYTDDEIKSIAAKRLNEQKNATIRQVGKWAVMDVYALYTELFASPGLINRMLEGEVMPQNIDEITAMTIRMLEDRKPGYEDIIALTYMHTCLAGYQKLKDIKYVIIDEAQDYTLMQYDIIKGLFPHTSFTMLGDINQSINPFVEIDDLGIIKAVFGESKAEVMRLNKSYRSTPQIVNFARALSNEINDIDVVDRPGVKPVVHEASNEEDLNRRVVDTVESLEAEGYKSIAVICRTADESRKVYGKIGKQLGFTLITGNDNMFTTGLVIMPSYLAKGLEFDAVIIYNAGDKNYADKRELRLLYTICTRALHKLDIYYTKSLSPLIKNVDRELYDFYDAD